MTKKDYLMKIFGKYLAQNRTLRETNIYEKPQESHNLIVIDELYYALKLEEAAQDIFKTGGESQNNLATYVQKMAETLRYLHNVDPYRMNPLKPLNDKVDEVLKKYAGVNFREFVLQTKPEKIEHEEYNEMPNGSLKYRLFEHRAKLHLAAIHDCEKMGMEINELLKDVRDNTIPYIKETKNEPTFDAILRVMGIN